MFYKTFLFLPYIIIRLLPKNSITSDLGKDNFTKIIKNI